MILENGELELLKLCGAARYLPCALAGKYNLEILMKKVAGTLLESGHIKVVNGGCKCYRLTRRGRDLLIRSGYDFPDDARPHKQGSIFDRRVISAELNTVFYSAGLNIYAKKTNELNCEDCAYIPSLTIRSDTRSKQLAGTRFYGILRILDTAYIIYYTGEGQGGIFPKYEQETFTNTVSEVKNIKRIVIVLAAKDEEGLVKCILPNDSTRLTGGLVPFAKVMEEWRYDFCMLPMNKSGVMQTRIMTLSNVRERIAREFGNPDVPRELNQFDAVSKDRAHIAAADMNISRVERAMRQSYMAHITPNIICLPNQRYVYEKLAVTHKYPERIRFSTINPDAIAELFPELICENPETAPARTKDGEYITV